MAGLDWVPQVDYGGFPVTNVGSNLVIDLMSPDADQDVIGKVEDTDDLFVHRIVGELFIDVTNVTAFSQMLVAIMPLQFSVTDVTAQLPWDPLGSFWSDINNANLRFWMMRTHIFAGTSWTSMNRAAGSSQADIPYWHHVDIKPRQKVGSRLNLWPTVVISLSDGEATVRCGSNLRLLVSGR